MIRRLMSVAILWVASATAALAVTVSLNVVTDKDTIGNGVPIGAEVSGLLFGESPTVTFEYNLDPDAAAGDAGWTAMTATSSLAPNPDTSSPYSITWDTNSDVTAAGKNLRGVAIRASVSTNLGNNATSSKYDVLVDNEKPTLTVTSGDGKIQISSPQNSNMVQVDWASTGITPFTNAVDGSKTGTHTGGNGAAALDVGSAQFYGSTLVGQLLVNTTQHTAGIVTANTDQTITAGGVTWDTGDGYSLVSVSGLKGAAWHITDTSGSGDPSREPNIYFYVGVHDGGNGLAQLSDSTANFGNMVSSAQWSGGQRIMKLDGSLTVQATSYVTANTSTTATSGITTWNNGDIYVIDFPHKINFDPAGAGISGTRYLRLAVVDNVSNFERNMSPILESVPVDIDTVAPDVTINQADGTITGSAAQADPTSALPIAFDVVFSEAINPATFTSADLDYTGSTVDTTAATATITEVGTVGNHTDYRVEVEGITGCGDLVVSIPAGGVEDTAGNTNNASTSTDQTVTYNGVTVTIQFDQATSAADETPTNPTINLRVTTSDGNPTAAAVTVDVTQTGGTATSGADYTFTNINDMTIPAGTANGALIDITATSAFSVIDDNNLECDETAVLTLSDAQGCGATLGDQLTNTVTIADNETANVGFTAATSNAPEGGGPYNIAVQVTGFAGNNETDIVVNLVDLGTGSATSGTDYTALGAPEQVTIPAGSTSANLSFAVTQDTLLECDETADLRVDSIASPACVAVDAANCDHTVTISDDTETATIGFTTATSTAVEDAGTHGVGLTVTLGGGATATGNALSITVTDAGGGTATSASDYTSLGAGVVVNIPAGSTSGTYDLAVLADNLLECDETVNLGLASPTPACVTIDGAANTHQVTITDSDTASVTFGADGSSQEAAGAQTLTLTLNLAAGVTLERALTVDVVDSGTGSATSGTDYTAFGTQTVTFPIGAANGATDTVTLTPDDDSLIECDETVDLNLTNSSLSCVNITDTYTHTITDDDTAEVQFFAATSNADEGTTPHNVLLQLNLTGTAGAASLASNLDVTVLDDGTGSAVAGDDYTAFSPATVTFQAGDTNGTLRGFGIAITDDASVECGETIDLSISAVSGLTCATINGGANTHQVTIQDNDGGQLKFHTTTATIAEDASPGTVPVTVELVLPGGSTLGQAVTVDVADAGTGTATSGSDYNAFNTETLTFPAGSANGDTQTVALTIINDNVVECGDETVNLVLQNIAGPGSCSVALDSAASTFTTTITEDPADTASVQFALTSSTVAEPNAGTTAFNVAVTLSVPGGGTVEQAFTVDVLDKFGGAGAGTATSGDDYTAKVPNPESLTFGPNAADGATVNYTLTIQNDLLSECDETINLGLENVASCPAVTLGTNVDHTVTITDDPADQVSVEITTADNAVAEPSPGPVANNITVQLNANAGVTLERPLLVTLGDDTAAATRPATAGSDYTAFDGTVLTFAAGSGDGDTQTFALNILGDSLFECDEDVRVTLASLNQSCATILSGSGEDLQVTTINDNETASVQWTQAPGVYTGSEGDASIAAVLQLTLGGDGTVTTEYPLTFDVVEGAGSTATNGTDYTNPFPGTVVFPAGSADSATQNFTIAPIEDGNLECTENVALVVQTQAQSLCATIGAQANTDISITDNESGTIGFSATSDTQAAENGGTAGIDVTLTISAVGAAPGTTESAITLTINDPGTGTATGGGTDYNLSAGPYTIPSGTASGSVVADVLTVTGVDDTLFECTEDLNLDLTGATGACGASMSLAIDGGANTYSVDIIDDDQIQITWDTDPDTLSEDGAPSYNAAFTVAGVGGTTGLGVGVTVQAGDAGTGTATAGGVDYTFNGGSVTVAAGTALPSSQSFNALVTLVDDSVVECTDESVIFDFSVTAPTGCPGLVTATDTMTLNIQDDEVATIGFNLANSIINEGDVNANQALDVVLTLTAGDGPATLGHDLTVNLVQQAGTAVAGTDFNLITPATILSGSDVTAAGSMVSVDVIQTIGDTIVECDPSKTLTIRMSNPSLSCVSVDAAAQDHAFTINEDDNVTVNITSSDQTISEDGSPTVPVDLGLSFNKAGATLGYDLDVSIQAAAATTAEAADYSFGSPADVTFASGSTAATTQTASFDLVDDSLVECQETVVVELASTDPCSTYALGAGTETVTIQDDEAVAVAFGSATYTTADEATAGNAVVNVTITSNDAGPFDFDADAQLDVVVNDLGTGSATVSTDYNQIGAGNSVTLTFTQGSPLSQNVTVTPVDDSVFEGCSGETVDLQINSATLSSGGLTCSAVTNTAQPTSTVTITEDETAELQFAAASASGAEATTPADDGSGGIEVILAMTGTAGAPTLGNGVEVAGTVTLNAASTATSGADFTFTSPTAVSITGTGVEVDGAQVAVLNVPIIDDTTPEPVETIQLDLGGQDTCAPLGGNQSFTYSIIDDDIRLGLDVRDGNGKRELNWVESDVYCRSPNLQSLLFSISYNPSMVRYNHRVELGSRASVNAEVSAFEELISPTSAKLWVAIDTDPDQAVSQDAIAVGLPTDGTVCRVLWRIVPGPQTLTGNDDIPLTMADVAAPVGILDDAVAYDTQGETVNFAPDVTRDQGIDVTSDFIVGDLAEVGIDEDMSQLNWTIAGPVFYRAMLYGDLGGLVPLVPPSLRGDNLPDLVDDAQVKANLDAMAAFGLPADGDLDFDDDGNSTAGEEGVWYFRRLRAQALGLGDDYTVPLNQSADAGDGVADTDINTEIDALNSQTTEAATGAIGPQYSHSLPANGEMIASQTEPIYVAFDEALYGGAGVSLTGEAARDGGVVRVVVDPAGLNVDVTAGCEFRMNGGVMEIRPTDVGVLLAGAAYTDSMGWPSQQWASTNGATTSVISISFPGAGITDLEGNAWTGAPPALTLIMPLAQ